MSMFLQLLVIGVMIGAIYGLVAVGFVLIYKASGIFNFAQGELVMIGAWVCWSFLEEAGLNMWLSLLLTFLIAALLGLVLERFALRPMIGQPLLAVVMMTIALSALLRGVVSLIWGGPWQVYPEGFIPSAVVHWGDVVISQQYIWSFIIAMLLVFLFSQFFQRTKSGLSMRATAEDQQAARALGISAKRIFAQAWVIACLISAVGGVLLGSINGLHLGLSHIGMKALPVVLLGGLESITGAVVGGLIIGLVESIVSGYLDPHVGGGLGDVIPFVIMVLVLVVRPYGLFGLKRIERV